MNKKMLTALAALLLPALAGAQGAPGADETAIRARLATYAEARNRGDMHGEVMSYAADGEFLAFGSKVVTGRAGLEKALGGVPPTYTFKLTVDHVRALTANVAVADTSVEAGPDAGHVHIFATYVMVKRGGHWLIGAARVGAPMGAIPAPK
jgi:uncharacterized protein (TIGR02246 family)